MLLSGVNGQSNKKVKIGIKQKNVSFRERSSGLPFEARF